MTPVERTDVAEALLAVVFSMRPDDGEIGQAWVLSIATTAMSRAILASVGPSGDATELLALSHDQVVAGVQRVQSAYLRDQLVIGVRQ
jgi:hypothetical protein